MSANLRICVPEETANYIKNPSFRFGTIGWSTIGNRLIVSDSFTRENGNIGITDGMGADVPGGAGFVWDGATWTISGNKAVNTPTLGAELLIDGALENWTSPTNLTSWSEFKAGSSTINQESVVVHGGSNSARLDIDSNNSNATIYQQVTNSIGDWIFVSAWLKCSVAGKFAKCQIGSVVVSWALTTNWAQYFAVIRATAANHNIEFSRNGAGSSSIYVDDVSAKIPALSPFFASVQSGVKDVLVETDATIVYGTQAGVVLNLDSVATPANFVLAYHDGTNAHLDKCVAGVYTSLINTAATYGSGKQIAVRKLGTSYSLYYDGVLIGVEQTISDAGIISNTLHGLFSSYQGNSFENFAVWEVL